METLNHAVGFRMVCRGGAVLDAPVLKKLSPNSRGKLRTSVGGDDLRDSVLGYPTVVQCIDDSIGRDVFYRYGCGPPGVAVDDC